MTLRLRHMVIECVNLSEQAKFWCAALGAQVIRTGEDLLLELPEESGRAQLHLCRPGNGLPSRGRIMWLHPTSGTLAQEVQRLSNLGATVVHKRHNGWGIGEVTLADPEGNEFVIDSSDEEEAQIDSRMATRGRDSGGPFWEGAESQPVDSVAGRVEIRPKP